MSACLVLLMKKPAIAGFFIVATRSHQSSLDAGHGQNAGRDFLDGEVGGVDIRDAFLVEEGLGGTGFHFALLYGGIAAIGFALVAYGSQTLRVYDQAEELLLVFFEGIGQAQVVEVIFGQGIVAHMYTELQGHIKGGRGFAGAGDAGEDDVGLVVMAGAGAVVVIQSEVHGLDTDVVGFVIDDGVGLAHGIDRAGAEFGSELADKGLEDIQHIAIGLGDNGAYVLVDDGVYDDGPAGLGIGHLIDLVYGGPGLVHAVHIGDGQLVKLYALELGQ